MECLLKKNCAKFLKESLVKFQKGMQEKFLKLSRLDFHIHRIPEESVENLLKAIPTRFSKGIYGAPLEAIHESLTKEFLGKKNLEKSQEELKKEFLIFWGILR